MCHNCSCPRKWALMLYIHHFFELFFQNIHRGESDNQQDSTECWWPSAPCNDSIWHRFLFCSQCYLSFLLSVATGLWGKRGESRRGCQLHLSLWVNELQEGRRRHPTVNTYPLISTTPLPSRKECSISPISGSPLANNEFWQILKYWQFDEWKKLLLYCWILLSLLY